MYLVFTEGVVIATGIENFIGVNKFHLLLHLSHPFFEIYFVNEGTNMSFEMVRAKKL